MLKMCQIIWLQGTQSSLLGSYCKTEGDFAVNVILLGMLASEVHVQLQ